MGGMSKCRRCQVDTLRLTLKWTFTLEPVRSFTKWIATKQAIFKNALTLSRTTQVGKGMETNSIHLPNGLTLTYARVQWVITVMGQARFLILEVTRRTTPS